MNGRANMAKPTPGRGARLLRTAAAIAVGVALGRFWRRPKVVVGIDLAHGADWSGTVSQRGEIMHLIDQRVDERQRRLARRHL